MRQAEVQQKPDTCECWEERRAIEGREDVEWSASWCDACPLAEQEHRST